MKSTSIHLAGLALLSIAVASPSWADSLASSASSAGSASLGSVSDSLGGSSDSSTGKAPVANGDYRVIEVAELAERAGMLRVKLQAVERPREGLAEFTLDLPRQALGQRRLAAGDVVQARQRPYGLEFAHAASADGTPAREAFFLVLADDWHRELDARALKL